MYADGEDAMGMRRGARDGYYYQDTEVRLLASLVPLLENKAVIDVGAERGHVVDALLAAGAAAAYAFEPFPASAEALRRRFGDNPSVRVFDLALGARDGAARLHVVEDKTGRLPDAYHTLVGFEETPTLRIVDGVAVQARTLDSLVAEGVLPPRVGILKVDTERGDLDVLRGMGRLSSAVVMVEFWDELPETVGPSPYSVAEVVRLMADRGYSTFVVVRRHDQFETLVLNAERTRPGDWGNVVFVHDTVLPRCSGPLFRAVADAQAHLVDRARYFAGEAERRQAVIEELAADSRQVTAGRDQMAAELRRRDEVIATLHQAAEARLSVIERLDREVRERREATDPLFAELERKEQAIGGLTAALQERLDLIDRLTAACEERDRVIGELTTAAQERLGTIERLNVELERKEAVIVGLATAAGERDRELAAQHVQIHRQAEGLREARSSLLLLSASRVYLLMRVLGRWGWLERPIRRALR